MQVFTTKKLIENIEKKGIYIDSKEKKKFVRYNYYQVINAYKNLFVEDVETIDDIFLNISQGKELERYKKTFGISSVSSNEELKLKICKYICKKYDRQPVSDDLSDYVKEIKEIDYYHHVYSNRVRYSDFIRMYKFEHELRTILLRYVLIIEESLKTIFVSHLNDNKVLDSFLMDINNYKTDSKNMNDSIDSIKLVLDKQKNKYSKPIQRKNFQRINSPYWIIINELTIKETLKIINKLKDFHYNSIYEGCLMQFTKVDLSKISSDEKSQFTDNIRNILEIIANFRNLLAHNQPLYLFNVKDNTTKDLSTINYDYPRVKNQETMNSDTMSMFAKFFGSDRYNSRTQNVKIDLSWIIYTIYKIISTLDSNNTLYDEIVEVFKKYGIVQFDENKYINDLSILQELFDSIDEFLSYEISFSSIVNDIEERKPYKSQLIRKNSEIKNYQRNLKQIRKKIYISKEKCKYNIFQFLNKYTDYTGIDKSYFDKLL